jgi:AraC-like DNA-binding protein
MHFKSDKKLYLFEFSVKGHGFLEINSKSYDFPQDSYFIIQPGLDNKYWSASGTIQEKIFFICRGTLVKALLETYELEKKHLIKDASSLFKYFNNMLLLSKQSGTQKDKDAALIFHKLIQTTHSIIYKDKQSPLPSIVQKLQKILDEHLEKKIDFATINKEITYSQAYLVRLFKKHLGVSPHEYILKRRLETAQLLLKHSNLSIKEIAERFIFSDQYYFSNFFKKRTGVSPSLFRKKSN